MDAIKTDEVVVSRGRTRMMSHGMVYPIKIAFTHPVGDYILVKLAAYANILNKQGEFQDDKDTD